MNTFFYTGVCISCIITLVGCDVSKITADKTNHDSDIVVQVPAIKKAQAESIENNEPSYTEQINELYEKAKAAGENVPEDVIEWAKSDMKKIGSFEYKILAFTSESDEAILKELNELGSERWEVLWIEPTSDGKKFYLKKANRSYIQTAGKFSSFIPIPGGAAE